MSDEHLEGEKPAETSILVTGAAAPLIRCHHVCVDLGLPRITVTSKGNKLIDQKRTNLDLS